MNFSCLVFLLAYIKVALQLLFILEHGIAISTNEKKDNVGDNDPAVKCQDIFLRDKNSPSGYYDILVDGQFTTVYCYFHNPQVTAIRQLYSLDGTPQDFQIELPVPVGNGDPEGAMEMQYEPGDLPPGPGPHTTQAIIDEQEKLYYNKTQTIQNLIDRNNRKQREQQKQSQQSGSN